MTMTTNRKAEDFDRALSAGGASVDPTMAALVAVAGALTALPQRPAPAFRDALRTKLMAEAAQLAAAASAPAAAIPAAAAPAASPLQAFARVLAKPAMQVATGGLAATIAAAGVGVGASRSLPGDTLYGLKRAVERIQNDLAGGTLAEADAVLEHAGTRVDEVLALIDRDAALGDIESALNDLKADIDAVTADLLAQVRAGSAAAYEKLGSSVRDLTGRLMALRERLPAEARDGLDAAMATLNAAGAQLAALPVPGAPGTPGKPGTPGSSSSPTPSQAPSTSGAPTPTTSSSPTSTKPPVSPSAPGVPSPTITVPTVTPPTVPTVEPTLPVTLPPLAP